MVDAHHRRVQRLVNILARAGDVVVELAGDGTPEPVHRAEDGVAVGDGVDQHAQGEQIVDLVERLALCRVHAHLLVDAVDVLSSPLHHRFDLQLRQLLLQNLLHARDVALARRPLGGDKLGDLLVFIRLEVLEG